MGEIPKPPDGANTWLDYRLKHQHVGAKPCWQCEAGDWARAERDRDRARIAELEARNGELKRKLEEQAETINLQLESRIAELEAENKRLRDVTLDEAVQAVGQVALSATSADDLRWSRDPAKLTAESIQAIRRLIDGDHS